MSSFCPFLAIFWLVWVNFMIFTCSWISNLVMRVKKNFLPHCGFSLWDQVEKRFSKFLPILSIKNEHVLMFFSHLTFIYAVLIQILHLFSRRATISTFLTSICLIFVISDPLLQKWGKWRSEELKSWLSCWKDAESELTQRRWRLNVKKTLIHVRFLSIVLGEILKTVFQLDLTVKIHSGAKLFFYSHN